MGTDIEDQLNRDPTQAHADDSRAILLRHTGTRNALLWILWFAVLLLLSFGPTLFDLVVASFDDADFAHVPFAPIVALYIAWTERGKLVAEGGQTNYVGLVLVFCGLLFLCAGSPELATLTFLKRTGFLLSLVGSVLFLRGIRTIRLLLYSILLLALMIPLPSFVYDRVTLPLQLTASTFAEGFLEVLGYSVLRDGNILYLPSQTLSVVEACSGLRSLYALFFMSVTYSYFASANPWMRFGLTASAVPIAVLANSGRIALTAMIGEHAPEFTKGIYHDMMGWSVFVVGFTLLALLHMSARAVTRIIFGEGP